MLKNFPALMARTRRFTIGTPQDFTIAPDGNRVLFLRAADDTNPEQSLWTIDVRSGVERELFGPPSGDDEVPAEATQLQERQRNLGSGVVGYSADSSVTSVTLALNSSLWVVNADGRATRLPTPKAVATTRISPDGARVAYVSGGEVRVASLDGAKDAALASPETSDVTYGLPEYVAAEDMHRDTGT